MARDLGFSRTKIAGIISNHQKATQSTDSDLPPPSLGKVPLARASKLDAYKEQLLHLLERYPRITAQRALTLRTAHQCHQHRGPLACLDIPNEQPVLATQRRLLHQLFQSGLW
jgi:hypothetical protein